MTTPDIDALVSAIAAGLDGVTPGPWHIGGFGERVAWVSGERWRDPVVRSDFTPHEWWTANEDAVAQHIARLDPDTVRAILAERASHLSVIARLRTEIINLERNLRHHGDGLGF